MRGSAVAPLVHTRYRDGRDCVSVSELNRRARVRRYLADVEIVPVERRERERERERERGERR